MARHLRKSYLIHRIVHDELDLYHDSVFNHRELKHEPVFNCEFVFNHESVFIHRDLKHVVVHNHLELYLDSIFNHRELVIINRYFKHDSVFKHTELYWNFSYHPDYSNSHLQLDCDYDKLDQYNPDPLRLAASWPDVRRGGL